MGVIQELVDPLWSTFKKYPRNVQFEKFPSIIASDVGLDPIRVFKHPRLLGDNFPLDDQVTDLAEGYEIPPSVIRFISIEVVNGQNPLTLLRPESCILEFDRADMVREII